MSGSSERCFSGQFVAVRGPLAGVAEGFLDYLWGRGYAPRTVETQWRMLRDLSDWLNECGVRLDAVDDDLIVGYSAWRRGRTMTLRSVRALDPLIGFLRERGVISPAAAPRVEGADGLLGEFGSYLAVGRGLAPATVRSYCSQVTPLVRSVEPAALTAAVVARFVDQHAGCDSARSVQVRINAVRALLRWLWMRRLIPQRLDDTVLSMHSPGGPPLPQGLSAAEVTALHGSLTVDPRARLRDIALIALMLRCGLRAGETTALRLDDLDWRAGTITVHGKRRRVDQVPLPVDVGEAIVKYLRDGRPTGVTGRHVFVAADAPHAALQSSAVTSIVGRAMRQAGIVPGAAHRLRHTAAMGVINRGGGLIEAGQLLRHATMSATGIYARADVAALAVIARPWPTVGV